MSSAASALAQVLAQHTDEDLFQAFQIFDSLRPEFRTQLAELQETEPLKRYEGVLGHFNYDKGFGFIISEEASNDFGGKDVFCSSNEIGHLKKNDTVSFTVVSNKNNQPQARLLQGPDGSIPQFLELTQSSINPSFSEPPAKRSRMSQVLQPRQPPQPPPPGINVPPPNLVPGGIAQPPRPAPVQPPPPASAFIPPPQNAGANKSWARRYTGTISSFNPEKFFGFISSERATSEFGKDVFLSSMEIGTFGVGDTVSFEVALNTKGQPQARNLSVPGKSGGRGTPVNEDDQTRYTGRIVSFMNEKHYGFIDCPDAHELYGKDVWVSEAEIAGFQVGDDISFRVVLNARGHPQARDLSPPE